MTLSCEIAGKSLLLDRYPPAQKNRSLQAWDAADILLTEAAIPLLENKDRSVLILNDAFGALTCALAAYHPIQVSDSWISQLATRHNLAANHLPIHAERQLDSLALLPNAELVLLKIPNNHSYLRYQLRQLKASLQPDTIILAATKAKDITQNLLDIFRQELGPVSASLTERKCRLITATIDPNQNLPTKPAFPLQWHIEEPPLTIFNHANVFSRDALDIGARFFLQHLPQVSAGQRVIDLGCGNGVLGVRLLQLQAAAHVVFCDESYMAIASAKLTLDANNPSATNLAEFWIDDCLQQQADNSADWIICNPPFHQQHAITDHIAWQMFADARRVLKPQGRLRIVANRHLGYSEKLARLFGGCIHIASNAKFTILEAIKRK